MKIYISAIFARYLFLFTFEPMNQTVRKPFYGLIDQDLLDKLRKKAKKDRTSMVAIVEALIKEMPK